MTTAKIAAFMHDVLIHHQPNQGVFSGYRVHFQFPAHDLECCLREAIFEIFAAAGMQGAVWCKEFKSHGHICCWTARYFGDEDVLSALKRLADGEPVPA